MSNWFRFYDDTVNDPKIIDLSDELFRAWVNLLCIAAKNDGVLPEIKHVALVLRVKQPKAAALMTKLVGAGLLDNHNGVFAPHNWQGRQFKSDDSGPRVKRHREKLRNAKRNGECNVTPPTEGNALEGEESKREESRADAPPPVDEDLKRRAQALGAAVSAHFVSRKLRIPGLERCLHWLQQGYSPNTVLAAVEKVLGRGKTVTSLEYFDGAIKDGHAAGITAPSIEPVPLSDGDWHPIVRRYKGNRSLWSRHAGPEPGMAGCRCPVQVLVEFQIDPATGADMTSGWFFVAEQTDEMAAFAHDAQVRNVKPPWVYEVVIDGVEKRGFFSARRWPAGYDEATGEKLPTKAEDAA